VAYLSGGARGIGVSARDDVFSPADSTDTQLLQPARDIPVDSWPTLSNVSGRFALTVAQGRRSALRDLAAVATALAVAAFGAWLLALKIPEFIVALTMVAMAVSPTFWGRGISWSYNTFTPAVALLAVWATCRWLDTRRRLFAAVATAAAVAAFMDWRLDVLETSGRLVSLGILAEFTLLGTFLLGIGFIVLVKTPSWRMLFTWGWLSLVMMAEVARDSTVEVVSLTLAIGGWTAVAIGLTWIRDAVAPRTGTALVTVIALIVIGETTLTRARLWTLGRDLPSELRTRIAADVRPADLPDQVTFIAEAHRADVMLRLAAKQSQRDLPFVPQMPDRISAAVVEGRTLLAFANARSNLERMGVIFERTVIGNSELNVLAGHAPCLDLKTNEEQDISRLIASESIIIHGSAPGTAPGSVVIRTPVSEPPQVSAIEPRSIPFDVNGSALRVAATGRVDPVTVTLASTPTSATAVAEEGPAVRVCPGVLRTPLTLGRAANAAAILRMNDYAPFAAGWHPIEADPDFFRWTAAPEALVRVSMAPPGPVRVTITATPAARAAQKPAIGLMVNTCRLPVQPMQQGQGDYEWRVGRECWSTGMNHLSIAITPLISPAALFKSHDTRLLGARIGAIRLARDGQ